MTDVFRLSSEEFYMASGQTVISNRTRHIRLGAGEISLPIYFGRTLDPQPHDNFEWTMYLSFGVSGLGWSRRSVVEIDRPPLDTRI